MKSNRWFLVLVSALLLFMSCQKNRYNFDRFYGVDVEGELLLPLASGSLTVMELMQSFQIDSLLTFDGSGNMTFNYYYEQMKAVDGEQLLRFKDLEVNEHYEIDNPLGGLLLPVDTVVSLEQTITFASENIHVLSAMMRSGHFEFELSSNVGNLPEMVITSSNIKDADGNVLRFTYKPSQGMTGFDLDGMHYETTEANTLNLKYEIRIVSQGVLPPKFMFDFNLTATDLAIKEMRGYVDAFESRNRLDTVFTLFPEKMTGLLEVNDIEITLQERNTFSLEAQLAIDTAMVWGEDISPYSILEPLPLVVDAPTSLGFTEVGRFYADCRLNAHQGHAMASSVFTVNPNGFSELVSVADTSSIDLKVDVAIPFAFNADEVRYCDTVGMKLDKIDSVEWVKKVTLELTLTSTIPLNVSGEFLAYDSVNHVVTDVLLHEMRLVGASYDGRPQTVSIPIVITQQRLKAFFESDHIIINIGVDTDGRDIVLNADQRLRYAIKADVEYDNENDD